jgi:hypothetical protein
MAKTLLLDTVLWDLVLDTSGNIAVASEPYALAQDAASAIRLFQGELYYDTTQGVPYWTQVLGKTPNISLMKQLFANAALTVPGVKAARVFINSVSERRVTGQVQITTATGFSLAANF